MGWRPRIGLLRVSTAATLAILSCAVGALGATQWDLLPYSVTMSQITAMGQASEGTKALVLEHDGPCTIHASVSLGGTAVLTLGPSGGPTLDTYYMLTGMADHDATWLSSTDFLARIYNTPAGAGTENLTLHVRGVPPADAAPKAGNYQATIVITVTF
jgi:spore coat protein U-like protein